jgi:hypothetical protein
MGRNLGDNERSTKAETCCGSIESITCNGGLVWSALGMAAPIADRKVIFIFMHTCLGPSSPALQSPSAACSTSVVVGTYLSRDPFKVFLERSQCHHLCEYTAHLHILCTLDFLAT